MSRDWLSLVHVTFITGGLLFVAAARIQGADFEGASALVEKLAGAPKAPGVAPSTNDDYIHLTKDLSLFSKQAASLAPEEAAKEWLALFDRGIALRNMPQAILQALPGPASWPELQKLLEARVPEQQPNPWDHALLLLIVHTLNNVEDKQWADLASMASVASNPATQQVTSGFDESPAILMLGSKLSTVAGSPGEAEKFWDRTLNALEQAPALLTDQDYSNLELPDLVTLLGQARAEPLLLRALLLPNTKFSAIAGAETENLARKLALANIDKLQQPPWFLTESLDGSDLYEALLQKFPGGSNAGAIYHVLALVTQGRQDEAVKAVSSINGTSLDNAIDQAAEHGYAMEVYDFLHALLKAHPESDSWDSYINLAAQTGHATEALQFVQESLAQKDLSDSARRQIQPVLYRALLAVDKIDEGVDQLRALIKAAKAAANKPKVTGLGVYLMHLVAGQTGTAQGNGSAEIVEWDIQLARIGHLLKRDSLEAEGLDDAKLQPPQDSLISYLIETGRNVEAEKLLIDAIVKEAAKEKANPQAYGYFDSYGPSQQYLVKLAQVYYNAGRWADILTLLQQVPGWSAGDLVDIAKEKAYSERYTPPSLGLMAARALSETGRTDEALPILDYVLQVDAGDDAAYELLLKIGKGDLVAKLDALYRQDQFQNRPLIWKATLLLQQGKIAEAEQACKTAITIDPSDGQTGKGDRMRVYSVMADICDAKKDATQAAFFRNVVKAIRLSEDANDFYDAGLLTRAVGMYGKALDLFSDAYCIQSRIARQLAELGRMDEAAAHYRKAFELMPVSFGRMESHCFGCERAFQGKTATTIAEKTFTDMLAKDPKKPQLYYLLGYLYMEEKRYPEAVTHFQKAAEIDPDYINAWKQIMDIGDGYQLSPDLRDEAVFNVLRLDPAGRHISPGTENIRELATLWNAEAASAKTVVPAPSALFSLTASAAERSGCIEQLEKRTPNGLNANMAAFVQEQIKEQFNLRWEHKPKAEGAPREAVLSNGIITAALQLFR